MKQTVVAKTFLTNSDGKILALKRSQTDTNRPGGWDIPGGWVEPGEDFAQAACRELQEEAGIDVSSGQLQLSYALTKVGFHELDESFTRLFFTAKTDVSEIVLSDEHDEYRWLTKQEAQTTLTHPPQAEALAYILENTLLSH